MKYNNKKDEASVTTSIYLVDRVWLCVRFFVIIGLVFTITACTRHTFHRGYKISPSIVAQINKNMTMQEARDFLGSPSLVSELGDTAFYYISSTFEKRVPFGEKEVEREILALYFNKKTNKIDRIADYTIEDGVIVDHISDTVQTSGTDINVLRQLFANIGRFNTN